MPAKRKHEDENENGTSNRYHPNADQAASFGIVLREFYPPEMSNARCEDYTNGALERPIEALERAYAETEERRNGVMANAAVVHWFKTDLRIHDNRALQAANNLAREAKIPLITLYILSPQDLTAHLISPARVDLILRSLAQLQRDLSELDIPLYIETQSNRSSIPSRIVDLCHEWGANHLFANIEYEVDELRREASLVRLCADNGIAFETKHDTCVVPPGSLTSQTGKQYAVYTHWFRAWVAFLDRNPDILSAGEEIGSNPGHARRLFPNLFDCPVPEAPKEKKLDLGMAARMRNLYPAGEHEGQRRLDTFLAEKGKGYDEERNFLAWESTSILSPYFTSGLLSTRTAVIQARKVNGNRIAGGEVGYISWISEVAWRDFYRHVLVHWPFICMNKCFKPAYTNLDWSYNEDHFTAWAAGQTGYPIVDAAMRQLNQIGWMHNRARMIVSSFLSKDLLIDWRRGERYFMEHLVDGDFASNHGGWGFGSSTGVDPQPYFRIFNPLRQSERFDPDGEYIRRWVEELRDVEGDAVHAPYERGAEDVARRNGYPEPIVKHEEARDRALKRFKEAAGGK
ncbi:DNA photolyase, FAD-binding/Cryptochrome [Aspergillus granulosus]|uniref:DNA photolyase, FAD-binding/Cryptochrome n=1 Tax=Aspergillus granulosus TaxID=176169 RepID=A0ABR4GTI0_9EURO